MSQSRAMSLVEAVADVAFGFAVPVALQMILFWLVGIAASLRAQQSAPAPVHEAGQVMSHGQADAETLVFERRVETDDG